MIWGIVCNVCNNVNAMIMSKPFLPNEPGTAAAHVLQERSFTNAMLRNKRHYYTDLTTTFSSLDHFKIGCTSTPEAARRCRKWSYPTPENKRVSASVLIKTAVKAQSENMRMPATTR